MNFIMILTYSLNYQLCCLVELKMPEELSINYQAQYSNLYCENDGFVKLASEEIQRAISTVIQTIPCVTFNTCAVSEVVTNCQSKTRKKRSLTQAGFNMSITTKPENGTPSSKYRIKV